MLRPLLKQFSACFSAILNSETCSEHRQTIASQKLLAFLAFVAASALSGVTTHAQQPAKKIPRIGVVVSGETERSSLYEAFQRGLRDLGYVEGQNLLIEYRYGEGKLDRMSGLVNELVEQKVDLLFVTNQVAIRAAKKTTKTTPIVMVSSVDPVMAGHVDSRNSAAN
jgi:putative ABC transport system substrate-binding protein